MLRMLLITPRMQVPDALGVATAEVNLDRRRALPEKRCEHGGVGLAVGRVSRARALPERGRK